jgi:hypothetical protein
MNEKAIRYRNSKTRNDRKESRKPTRARLLHDTEKVKSLPNNGKRKESKSTIGKQKERKEIKQGKIKKYQG